MHAPAPPLCGTSHHARPQVVCSNALRRLGPHAVPPALGLASLRGSPRRLSTPALLGNPKSQTQPCAGWPAYVLPRVSQAVRVQSFAPWIPQVRPALVVAACAFRVLGHNPLFSSVRAFGCGSAPARGGGRPCGRVHNAAIARPRRVPGARCAPRARGRWARPCASLARRRAHSQEHTLSGAAEPEQS